MRNFCSLTIAFQRAQCTFRTLNALLWISETVVVTDRAGLSMMYAYCQYKAVQAIIVTSNVQT
jgi:hypothetical protein